MSARKTAAARVGTKPLGKRTPEPAARTRPRKDGKPLPAESEPCGTDDMSAAAQKLAADIECALAAGRSEVLTPEAIQALIAVACRGYAAQVEASGNFPALAARSRVTSTDVMVTASGLLKAANLAVFELGMWQSWTGR